MGIEDVLGAISPAFSVISGKGPYADLAQSGLGGIIPQVIANSGEEERKKKEEEERKKKAQRGIVTPTVGAGMKKGGKVKKMAKGGAVKSSASKRADGCAQRGKTRGKMV